VKSIALFLVYGMNLAIFPPKCDIVAGFVNIFNPFNWINKIRFHWWGLGLAPVMLYADSTGCMSNYFRAGSVAELAPPPPSNAARGIPLIRPSFMSRLRAFRRVLCLFLPLWARLCANARHRGYGVRVSQTRFVHKKKTMATTTHLGLDIRGA
jgi:hypothetical protein